MHLIEDLYLGWQPLTHTRDCPAPAWDVAELRFDDGIRRVGAGVEPHACATEGCTHADGFPRVQLRLLCRNCETVYTVAGEGLSTLCTTTSVTGWGQQPRRVGGVWLWPGQPVPATGKPHDYLVTRDRVPQVTPADIAGIITAYWDSEGRPRWIAGADLNPDGAHQVHSLRWTHRSAGLQTVDEAAAWINSTVHVVQQPLVVTV